jgi:hypothetical protein
MPSNPDFDPNSGLPISRNADGTVAHIGPVTPAPIVPSEPMQRGPIGSWKSPIISQEEAETVRPDYIKHAAGKGATLEDQSRLDAIAAENFDNAMRAEGLTPPNPADHHPDDLKLMSQAGISAKPRASDYYAQLPQQETLPADRYANVLKVTGTWAAEIGLSRELGQGLIGYIADKGPALGRLSQADKQKYSEAQTALGEKLYGGKDFAAMKAQALDVLKYAPGEISDGLRNSPLANSVQVLSMLSTHAKTVDHLVKRSRSR